MNNAMLNASNRDAQSSVRNDNYGNQNRVCLKCSI